MELDSGADSVSSTPRSTHFNPNLHKPAAVEDRSVVRLMCSFGGKILPRPHDNQLRYVGGDTRIVAIHRSNISFPSLLTKLSKLIPPNSGEFTVKYQLPHEDLDALITVSTDEDVDNMLEEFDRLLLHNSNPKTPRLRLFLFPNNATPAASRTSSIASLLDGSRKRESWFLDALNGEGTGGLERGRSEASSIVSEVPDYLFGLDNSDESHSQPAKLSKNRTGLSDVSVVAGSDPGSPAVQVSGSSPFGSTSSAPAMMPNLPPVKTKPEIPVEEVTEPPVQTTVGYPGGPVWTPNSPYRGPPAPMQAIPVYYMAPPGPGPNPGHGAHIQPVPVPVTVPGPYVQQYGAGPGPVQMPVGYSGSGGPMYQYEMQMQGNMVAGQGAAGQPVYYGVKNPGQHGMVGAPYPGMVQPMGIDDGNGSGQDPNKVRAHQV